MLFFAHREKNFHDALSFYSKRNYKQTVKICETLLKDEPDNCEVLNLMGDAYAHMDNEGSALGIYDSLLKRFENENRFDKAVALTKKIMRIYPDKEAYRERLADLFGIKRLFHEQLGILSDLLQEKHRRGYTQEAERLIRKITAVKTENIADLVSVIALLRRFGTAKDVRTVTEKALSLPHLSGAELSLFVNAAADTAMDIELYVKRLPEYFAMNPDKVEAFTHDLAAYFEKNFDRSFFSTLITSVDTALFVPLLTELKPFIIQTDIYEPLLDEAAAGNGAFESLVFEIAALPEDKLDNSFTKLCYKHIEKLNSVSLLEAMRTIIDKTRAADIKHDVLQRLLAAYKNEGSRDKAQALEEELYGNKAKLIGEETEADSIPITSFERTEDPEIDEILELSLMDDPSLLKKPEPKIEHLSVPASLNAGRRTEAVDLSRLMTLDESKADPASLLLSVDMDDFDDIHFYGEKSVLVKQPEHFMEIPKPESVQTTLPADTAPQAALLTIGILDELFDEDKNKK